MHTNLNADNTLNPVYPVTRKRVTTDFVVDHVVALYRKKNQDGQSGDIASGGD